MMYVTATVSALLVFIFIKLSFSVIELRKIHKVSIGSGGVDALERAMRAHANFAEYAPLGLVLIATLSTSENQRQNRVESHRTVRIDTLFVA